MTIEVQPAELYAMADTLRAGSDQAMIAQRRVLSGVVGAPLQAAVDDVHAVAQAATAALGGELQWLGDTIARVADSWLGLDAAAQLSPQFLSVLATDLARREADSPFTRRDQLAVDPERDALADVLQALADAGDPTTAALLLGGDELWDQLLARVWTTGPRSLVHLIGTASGASTDLVDALTLIALAGVGRSVPGQYANRDVGSPAAFTTQALSGCLALLVADHLDGLVPSFTAGIGGLGAADPLADRTRDALRGLGEITLDPVPRSQVLQSVVAWAIPRLADPAGRADLTAGYFVGSIFSGLGYGEWLQQRFDVAVVVRDDAAASTLFDLVTPPLAFVDGATGFVAGQLAGAASPASHTDAIVGMLSVQPATASADVSVVMTVAGIAATVPTGGLPAPTGLVGDASAHAADAAAAARAQYEAALTPGERETYEQLVHQEDAAVAAFSSRSDLLDVLDDD